MSRHDPDYTGTFPTQPNRDKAGFSLVATEHAAIADRLIIVEVLLDAAGQHGLDLNEIAVRAALGQFTPAERVQFAQLIGYSVDGFAELSYVDDTAYANALVERERVEAALSQKPQVSGPGNVRVSGNHTNTSAIADSPHADVVSEPAPLSGAENTGASGKPRRLWVALAMDGTPLDVMPFRPVEWASAWQRVVPVVEARVTRETVERVADAMRNGACGSSVWEVFCSEARAALSALGLTVEE